VSLSFSHHPNYFKGNYSARENKKFAIAFPSDLDRRVPSFNPFCIGVPFQGDIWQMDLQFHLPDGRI
jgi:hypothetical protein